MAFVKEILQSKGNETYTVDVDSTVLDALNLMAEKDIGGVLVTEHGRLVGIFTERHYARKVFIKGRSSPSTLIRDVMASDLVTVTVEDNAEKCMSLMTRHGIRHLPVIRDSDLVGIVSIGDLMQSIIEDREFDVEQLIGYVRG